MEPGNQNHPHSGRRAALGLGVLGLALAGVVMSGALPRLHHSTEMRAEAQQALQTDPSVTFVSPSQVKGSSLLLPGNIQAAEETTVYARTNGYLRHRFVDIGTKVRVGQLLAEIESPEVDQQLRQAQAETLKSEAGTGQARAETARLQASVAQAIADAARLKANLEKANSEKIRAEAKLAEVEASASNARAQLALAKQNVEGKNADLQQAQAHQDIAAKTSERWQGLARQGAVSQQDADERLAGYLVSKASVRSYASAILSAQAQVEAAQQSVNAADSQIAGAKADVRTSEQDIRAARSALASGEANVRAARESVNAGKQNVAAAQAGTQSSQANVQRVGALKSFEQVTAPFSGVVTSRNVDTGALINAGSTGEATGATSKSGLFGLARIDTLRIHVNVPQSSVRAVRPGQPAKVLVQEFPGKEFAGTVSRISGAMDPASRTLLTEISLPNRDGKLIPGMYAQVKFDLPQVTGLRLPASVLVTGNEGTRIAVIAAGNKVHYVPVKVGRDFGSEVEILTGVNADNHVIVGPSAALKEGTTVRPAAQPAPDHR